MIYEVLPTEFSDRTMFSSSLEAIFFTQFQLPRLAQPWITNMTIDLQAVIADPYNPTCRSMKYTSCCADKIS